jgi:hypothetical protein
MKAEDKALTIRKKQIDFMYQSLPTTIIGVLTLSYILWDIENIHQEIVGWIVINALILNWRFQILKKYKK